QREGSRRGLAGEDVLPDGVARARVEELDPPAPAGRPKRPKIGPRLVGQHLLRPARALDRLGREVDEVELAQHAEIVIPDEAELRALGDLRAARVRTRPVADEVAEAPELVRPRLVDGSEHG